MYDYIEYIKIDDNYGGDFTLSIVYDLYNINISQYITIYDFHNNLNKLQYIYYYIITILIKIKIY